MNHCEFALFIGCLAFVIGIAAVVFAVIAGRSK